MSIEIIQGCVVAYENYYDDFQQNLWTSYFHKKISFHYFGDYLMTKLILG
jgi:hypothetical protein